MINLASRPFYQLADRILGSQFLQDIAEFFLNFQSMYDGFEARARAVEGLLHDRRTAFVVVTTLEGAPLREAEFFCEQLTVRGFHLGALVLNRVLPSTLLEPGAERAAAALSTDAETLADQLVALAPELGDAARNARVLRTAAGSFRDFSVEAKREAELRAELARIPDVVAAVPAYADDIGDLAGLARIAGALLGATPVP
jgi:anion-transporting  ArsA/GET3 family ATPase